VSAATPSAVASVSAPLSFASASAPAPAPAEALPSSSSPLDAAPGTTASPIPASFFGPRGLSSPSTAATAVTTPSNAASASASSSSTLLLSSLLADAHRARNPRSLTLASVSLIAPAATVLAAPGRRHRPTRSGRDAQGRSAGGGERLEAEA